MWAKVTNVGVVVELRTDILGTEAGPQFQARTKKQLPANSRERRLIN